MAKVIVLGGAGEVGSVAARALAGQPDFERVIVGDLNTVRAEALAKDIGTDRVEVRQVDAMDRQSIAQAIEGCDIVLNCVGPFYKSVKNVLETVLQAGIHYVDVCDDVDVTLDILDLDKNAKELGVTALIGMGSSPGVTNILAAFAANTLLDETESVDIFHAHGGEPNEGPGVIGHRFHCMSIDIPMFIDGELRTYKFFEPDGVALRQTFDFPILGDGIELYPYPHPEQVTLPKHLKLRQVTNKGTVLPRAYYELTRDMCQLGLSSREPVEVNGQTVTPYDFAIAYILRERERILRETDFGSQRGCVSVIVKGTKNGKREEFRFHLASKSQALGEGTGIPAAMGTLLVHRGEIATRGVMPPEACVDPMKFMALLPSMIQIDNSGGDGFGGVQVQRVAQDGTVTELDLL